MTEWSERRAPVAKVNHMFCILKAGWQLRPSGLSGMTPLAKRHVLIDPDRWRLGDWYPYTLWVEKRNH